MKCGCAELSRSMADVLRSLADSVQGDFRPIVGPLTIKLSRDCAGRSAMSVRRSLIGLRARRLVRPMGFDTWQITGKGLLWASEHPA